MQIHLNGFQKGDPRISNAAPATASPSQQSPTQVDVLIVGSGPTGLVLASQLAAFPKIKTRVIEKRNGPLELGQADGISCRSMEMFNAFGLAHQIAQEGHQVSEISFWLPDDHEPANISRVGRVDDAANQLSEMPHIILNQARVHGYLLEYMRNSPTRLEVDYQCRMLDLHVDSGAPDYPVTVNVELADGGSETIRCRYVVGCDGARSSVREGIGQALKGEYAHQSWGVMDVLAVTDFPDIRTKTIIKSANEGTVLIVPREGGYLCRIYVALDELDHQVASLRPSLAQVVAATQRILRPYSFEVKECAWWSVYQVGHSIADKFDDADNTDAPDSTPRVFIAGDACHTHSAKAGQGMNVSMGDAFNLGWKLVSVLTGKAAPELLNTYSEERHEVAQVLIDYDHEWSRHMSAPPDGFDGESAEPLILKLYRAGGEFTAGLSVRYAESNLIGARHWQNLATGFPIGSRFHSAPVVRLIDAKPMHLGHCISADVRWHLFIFAEAAPPLEVPARVAGLSEFLSTDSRSPVLMHTPIGHATDSVISTWAVFQQDHVDLDFSVMPPLLKPTKGRYELIDYEKVYCPAPESTEDIFDARGIDRSQGCMVIVRPDQYVAHVLPLDAFDELSGFFAGFLKPAAPALESLSKTESDNLADA